LQDLDGALAKQVAQSFQTASAGSVFIDESSGIGPSKAFELADATNANTRHTRFRCHFASTSIVVMVSLFGKEILSFGSQHRIAAVIVHMCYSCYLQSGSRRLCRFRGSPTMHDIGCPTFATENGLMDGFASFEGVGVFLSHGMIAKYQNQSKSALKLWLIPSAVSLDQFLTFAVWGSL
jgi:hypothetical protein